MILARLLLILGAALLLAAAGLHVAGGGEVARWLSGERGTVIQILWYLPAIDWIAVALAWLFVAWRAERRLALLVCLLSIVPAGAAIAIAAVLGTSFIGAWLLAGGALLAILGSVALPLKNRHLRKSVGD